MPALGIRVGRHTANPMQRNAHPHVSMNGRVVVVHNGIVENFIALRDELEAEGVTFDSDTDTEVIVQMMERYVESGVDDGNGRAPNPQPAARRQRRRRHGTSIDPTSCFAPVWATLAASPSAWATMKCSSLPTFPPFWNTHAK